MPAAPAFRRLGGLDQLHIASAEDLDLIETLDEARWVITSAPLSQLPADPGFLIWLDADADGRVRVLELRAARRWTWARLKGRAHLGEDVLHISDLDGAHPDAAALRAAAGQALAHAGASGATVSLAQIRALSSACRGRFPNGDGVVPAGHAGDADKADLIAGVVAVTGGAPDASGAPGADAASLDAWIARAGEFSAWRAAEAGVSPLGPETAAAAARLESLDPLLSRWFAQSALLRMEAGAAARLQTSAEQLAALDVSDPRAIQAFLAAAPVAPLDPAGVLDLDGPLNPEHADGLRALAELVPRLLGEEGPLRRLDAPTWARARAALAPFRAWTASAPAGIARDADPAALLARTTSPAVGALRARMAADAAVKPELDRLQDLEHLTLAQRWLLELANNLVAVPRLFEPGQRALFQAGTLILDGRRLDLCSRVEDRAAHKRLAERSGAFVVYVDAVRQDGGAGQALSLACALTSGVRGGVELGKRGVFYDRDGQEWDAVVVDLLVAPISLWEATIAPFVRLRDSVAARFEKAAGDRASGAEAGLGASADAQLAAAPTALPPGPPAPPPPAPPPAAPGAGLQGALIGGSIAFAALGSAVAFLVQTIAATPVLTLVGALLAIVAAVLAASALVAWLRLRRRDLSALLEATGMALNGRMRLSRFMAGHLTTRPRLPAGATVRDDEPRGLLERVVWALFLLLLALVIGGLVAWRAGVELPWPSLEPEAPIEVVPVG